MLEILKDNPHFFEKTIYKVEYVDVPDEQEGSVSKVLVQFTDGSRKALCILVFGKKLVEKGKEIFREKKNLISSNSLFCFDCLLACILYRQTF